MSPSYLRILENLKKKKSSKKRLRKKPALRLEALEPRTLMSANPFTPGDIIVLQIGNSTDAGNTSSGTNVYLDEYTANGTTLVQQIELSNSTAGGNIALTMSGSAGVNGQISLSPNGSELAIFGYNANQGTASVSGSADSVGVVGANGTILYEASSTNLTSNANGVGISAANAVYIGGNSGLYYAGTFSNAATSVTGTAVGLSSGAGAIQVDNGQLFGTINSGANAGIYNFGSSLPTGSTTPTELPISGGFVDANGASVTVGNDQGGTASYTAGHPYAFFFANVSGGSNYYDGYNTLYVADEKTACGAILKYSYNGTDWVSDGGIEGLNSNASIIGLTGTVSGSTVSLVVTAGGDEANSNGADGYIYTVTDNTGFAGNLSAKALAQDANFSNSANAVEFRGVVQAPDDGDQPITGLSGTTDYTVGSGAQPAVGASAADVTDQSNFMGGNLTIALSSGQSGDTLGINNQGTGAGQIGVSGGTITYGGNTIGTYTANSGGSSTLTIAFNGIAAGNSVTPAAVQALINDVTFQTSDTSVGDTNRTLSISLNQNGQSSPTTASQTIQLQANPPTFSVSPSSFTIAENAGQQTISLSNIANNGNGGDTVSITATSNNASVVANSSLSNSSYSGSAANDSLTFTPVANAAGNATITITVEDTNDASAATANVTVNVIGAPTITAPGTQTATEDLNQTISGVSIADSFLNAGNMTVTLSDVDGTLTANGTVGATVTGNGTADVTLTGTVSQINATLGAGLVYDSGALFNGTDTLTILANDTGNTALGTAQSSSATVNITVSGPTLTPVSFTGSEYTQNFDGLVTPTTSVNETDGAGSYNAGNAAVVSLSANLGNSSVVPSSSFVGTNGLAGWYGGSSNAAVQLGANPGDQTTGGVVSVGANSATADNRALGLLSTNTNQNTTFGVLLENNTGAAINSIEVSFLAELFRTGSGGSGVTKDLNFNYLEVPSGDLSTTTLPVTGATNVSALSVSAAAGTAAADSPPTVLDDFVNQTVSLSTAWNAGDGLWITWQMPGNTGAGDGLAIDNFAFSSGSQAPTALTSSSSAFSANVAGNVVGTLSTTDPGPAGQAFSYALVSGIGGANNANFTVNANTGVITTNGGLSAGTYTIGVQTTDQVGDTYQQVLTLDATNNDPTINAISPDYVGENSGLATVDLLGIGPGIGGAGDTIGISATSDNTSLIPNPSVTYTSPDTTGSLSFTPATNGSGTANITVTVTDSVGDTNSTQESFEVTVVGTPTITAPANQTAGEDYNHVIPFSASAISDSYLNAGNMTVTLSDTAGNLTANGTIGATVTGSGNSITLTGNVSQIDATLHAGITYNAGPGVTGNDTLTITANDTGNTALGSPQSSSATLTVDVVAPSISTNSPLATPAGQKTSIYGTDSGIITANTMLVATDPDYGNSSITYTITSNPAYGTLYSNASGSTVALMAGTANDTFTQANINGSTSEVWFVANANAPGGTTGFGFSMSDGVNPAVTGNFTIKIDTPTVASYGTPNANYTQSFNDLADVTVPAAFVQDGPFDLVGNASANPPQGISACSTDAGNLTGWSIGDVTGSTSVKYANDTSSSGNGTMGNGGAVYGYANSPTSTNWALGLVNTTGADDYIELTLENTTGDTLNQVTINYTGEQWHESTHANTLDLSYQVNGGSFANAAAGLDYTGSQTGAANLSLDGSQAGNQANVNGTIAGLNWANGTDLVLRFELANQGSSAGLAIANFSLSADSGPTQVNANGTSLPVSGNATIGNSTLQFSSSDNIDANLTYSLNSVPNNGNLYIVGNATPLAVNSTFTQAQVDDDDLSFVAGSSVGTSNFAFTVTDPEGALANGTYEVAVGEAPLTLTANSGLTLNQGTTANITTSELNVTETDVPDSDITYTLSLTPLTRGTLIDNGNALVPGGTFTQYDIDNNLLSFVDGNATSNFTDTFSFTADDSLAGGNQTVSGNFDITVTPVPTVTTNTGVATPMGATTYIHGTVSGNITSNTMLNTSDGSVTSADLTYTLTSVPTDGNLYITGNATPLANGSTFTQSDIIGNTSQLYYVNSGAASVSTDSFSFTVSDGTNTSANTTFNIAVDTPTTVSYGTANSTYTQNFNALPSTPGNGPTFTQDGPFDFVGNATSTPPQGIGSNATLDGWSMDQYGNTALTGNLGNSAVEKFITDNGNGQTTGAVYSYGANGASNRALGIVGSPTTTSEIGITLVNNTGETLNQISVAYLGEQWTSNANLNTLAFDYALGDASITGADFTAVSALNYAGTITSANAAENANGTPLTSANVADTIAGLDWTPGETLVLRWQASSVGSGSGLAIDNFSFSAATTPPTFTDGGSYTGSVNTQTLQDGDSVANVSATPETGDTLSFAITGGNANGAFAVAANGAITVANAAALAGISYTLTVEATDTTNEDTANATIDVTVQSPPVFSGAPYSGTINTATAANGTAVANVTATPETGDTLSFAITGGNANGAFAIAANGAITVANAAALAGTGYTLSVEATDTTNEDTANATVDVTVQSPPVFSHANYPLSTISATIANGTSVGNVTATPESGDTLSYALSGAGNSAFAVNGSGNITVANDSALSPGNYTLTLTATDTTNEDTATANVTIAVSNLHVSANQSFAVNKSAANGAVVGTFVATDNTAFTYSLANSANGAFAINANTGVITIANATALPTFAAHANFANTTIEVEVTDSAGSITSNVAISDSANNTMTPTLGANDANQTITVAENSKAGGVVANLANDVSAAYAGQKFSYSLSGTDAADFSIKSGVITADSELAYGTASSYELAVDVADSKNANAVSVMDLTINVTDQVPTITGANGALTVNDNKTIDPFSKMKIGDVVAGQALTVTITLENGGTDGTLSGNAATGAVFTPHAANGTYTITGDAAAVTTTIEKLVFTPKPNLVAVGQTTDTTFTVEVNDGLGTANSTVTDGTTEVGSLSINDPPTITGAVANQAVTDETTIKPFIGMTIADPDVGANGAISQTESVSVTLSKAVNGNLSLANGTLATAVDFSGSDGVYTFSGITTEVTTALDALIFTPAEHQVAPGKTVTTTFTVAVSDGVVSKPTTNKTASVIATAVNDLPTVAVGTASLAVNDGTLSGGNTTIALFSASNGNVAISDPDYGVKDTLTVTLANATLGTLSGGGVKETANGSGIYAVTANMATLALDLANITFTPKQNLTTPGTVTDEGISFTVAQDTAAGNLTTAAANMTLAITSINNAPTISGTSNTAIKLADNQTVNPFSSKVKIADVDVGQTETVTVTLSDKDNGTLSLANVPTGATFTPGTGNAAGSYTITGNATVATTALQDLLFTPTAHQVTPGASVATTFTIAVTDSGNVTTGTDKFSATPDTKTNVSVKAVDDGPTAIGATIASGIASGVGAGGRVAASAVVANLSAVDADFGETFTYSVSGGSNKTLFQISGNELEAKSALPIGTYQVAVTVADAGGKKVTRTLSVVIGADSSSLS